MKQQKGIRNRLVRVPVMALVLALGAGVALAGNDANVRVVHASPDAPTVDVIVNDAITAFPEVEFGEATGYSPLPAGVYNVKVTPSGESIGSAVIDADLSLFYNRDYTVVAVDVLDDIAPIVLVDENRGVSPRQAKVRFVHASPDAPAVDIKVVDGPFLFQGVAFKEVGDYITVPDGIYSLEVRIAGTDTVALELPGVALDGGTIYTVFATGFAGGQPGLGVTLTEDFTRPGRGPRFLGGFGLGN